MQARGAHGIERHDAAAQEEIRRRAMRHARARGGDGLALALAEMDAMPEHRARREQPALRIHIRVIPRAGELVPHLLDLLQILREMRLDMRTVAARQLRRAAHELLAARHGEARAERVFEEAVVRAMPGLAQALGLMQRDGDDLRRLERAVAAHVHHHFSHHDPQPALRRGVECGLARVLVNRGIDHRRRGAVPGEFGEERAALAPAFRSDELALQREYVLPQPRQQLALPAGHRGVLREVRVQVDEAGENRRAPRVQPPHRLRARLARELRVIADLRDRATSEDERAVAPRAETPVFRRVDEEAPQPGEGRAFVTHRSGELAWRGR